MSFSLRSFACTASLATAFVLSAQERAPLHCPPAGGLSRADRERAQAGTPDRDVDRYVQLHVIIGSQPGPGGDAVTTAKVQRDLDEANALFAHNRTGIQFALCGPIRIVDDQRLYDQSNMAFEALDPLYEPGYLTVVYGYYLAGGNSGLSMNDLVFLSPFRDGALMAHELGHALGLMHTHDSFIPEFVDGSNCTFAGDAICDTPAEPQLDQPGLVDRSDCSYIGTLTDPHGDLYTPLMGNIMSYAPCAVDTFTAGQVQVMQYVLDGPKAHLHRTTSPVRIDPFATRACRPGSTPLSASPAPGTFSGDLLAGNTVQVSALEPPGMHSVSFTPTAPADSSTFIDQAMVMFTFNSWPYPSALTDSLVQTFRAGADGRFTSVDVMLCDVSTNTYRLRLYGGTAPSTTLLATALLNRPGASDTAWVHIDLAGNVPVSEGAHYTLELTAQHAFRAMTSGGGGNAITDYVNGTSNLPVSTSDAIFRTWVHALPPCMTAWRYYEVYDPPIYTVPSLASAYCPSESTPVPLIGYAPGASASHFLVDGTPATSIVPSALSEGTHTVAFVNTTFGCTDVDDYTFTVAPPEAVIAGLDAPLCPDGAAFPLSAEPAGGAFTIDGTAATQVDPGSLGVGVHTVSYTFNATLDQVAFNDQMCCGSAFARESDYATLGPGGSFVQSFIPAFSGRLDSIAFVVTADQIRTYRWGATLFAGEGTGGTVLGTDTLDVNTWNAQPNLSGDIHPQVEAGLPYTLRVERLADTVSIDPYVFYFRHNSYTSGSGQLNGIPDVDLRFMEYVSTTYTCDGLTEVPLTILSCNTGIAGTGTNGFSTAPNPFNEAFTLRTTSDVRYTVLNSLGAEVLRGRANAHTNATVDASGLAAGTYVLRCITADGRVLSRVLVRAQ